MVEPIEVRFLSGGVECAAWFFIPDDGSTAPRPVVVLGHGLGGTRDMRLGAFAELFVADGYAALVFDYRHFGDSDGEPRQLLDVGRQLADWAAAIAYVRSRPECDPDRVVLWGSSFGGGHVITAAARDGRVAAVVAQCPFTDGPSAALRLDPRASVRVGWRAARDIAGAIVGRPPVMVALAGPRGSASMMTSPDAEPGYAAQIEGPTTFRNEIAARFAAQIVRYRPGRRLREVGCPVLLCLCTDDTVAPPGPARRAAARSATTEVLEFTHGHFGIYTGEAFVEVSTAQRKFLRRHVPVAPGS